MVATRSLKRAESARKLQSSECMTGVLPAYAGILALTLFPHFVAVPVSTQLIPTSLLLLYVGCHISLRNLHRGGSDENQTIGTKDAYMVPVFGSIALLSLYAAYKFLPPYYLNLLVTAYFFLVGVISMSSSMKIFISTLLSLERYSHYNTPIVQFRLPYLLAKLLCDSDKKDDDLIQISALDLPCAVLASSAALWYLNTKHPMSNNIFGIAFTIQALSLITVDSFMAGTALLLGLFFYDIFFVFATDVMVTVATKFDAPIKLLFPRGGDLRPSMLGLGDVVIPGIFLSLMLRLDHQIHCNTKNATSFSKPYFWSCMIGYLVGIAVTLYIMFAFEHAQPALLYLVPGCLLSVIVCGLVRREVLTLFMFKDDPEVKDHVHQE